MFKNKSGKRNFFFIWVIQEHHIHKAKWEVLGCKPSNDSGLSSPTQLGKPFSPDHPTWNAAALEVVLPNVLEVYSPFILLGFNEEEYLNQTTEKGNEGIAEVDGADICNELEAGVGGEGVGNEDQDMPPKCNLWSWK
ncbi:hypothetical protein Acr_04g0001460 [Actinidia rufa]|uniref:Uncharacterized protein n=1 Tax=Actinidia rufa TaxID=165716 RepID=A0A7J0EG13_9ERIC|nr:hypothetical protein Acr_04g0001460 [Actinidia rufa]